jgi:hypothetical protein
MRQIPQNEDITLKDTRGGGYGEIRWRQVEQVIAPDGRPAVRMRIWKIQYHTGAPTGRQCLLDGLYRFPTPTPGIAVGQWRDTQLRWNGDARALRVNYDTSTYQDFIAWDEAFTAVYDQS